MINIIYIFTNLISSLFKKNKKIIVTCGIDFDNYGVTKYGKSSFVSLIKYNKSIATQFHPEKSGKAGLNLIKYFYDQ
jgi:imidazoleglycerol phosphate synthase glutamine amidotransferase subunit HisH